MSGTGIHSVPGLVDVVWHSEYDEGTAVRDAVLAALEDVNANGMENWLADLSHSTRELSEADLASVSGEEFLSAMRASTLRRVVLVPPLPETGQDTGWLADWESSTLGAFGVDKSARIISELSEIRAFLKVPVQGATA